MPFPKEAFTIHGGCNCRAIRYELSVPPHSERPKTPYVNPGADIGDYTVPAVYLDHCNDCRRATSAVLPMALVCEARTVRVSVLSRATDSDAEGAFTTTDAEREWKAAVDVFDFRDPGLKNSYLAVYKSSPQRSRWFCSRCGTMFAYSVDPGVKPAGFDWIPMVDLWLGTVDREDLEKDWMHPERMAWCEKGVPWVRRLARNGAGGIPEHPVTKLDVLVDDDIE